MKIETLVIVFLVIWAVIFPVTIVRANRRWKTFDTNDLTEEERSKRVSKFRPFLKSLRTTGWGLLIVGSIILLANLPALLDPEATINVNGQQRKEIWIKVLVTLFASTFPAIGAIIVLTPKQKMEILFLRFQEFTERIYKLKK